MIRVEPRETPPLLLRRGLPTLAPLPLAPLPLAARADADATPDCALPGLLLPGEAA